MTRDARIRDHLERLAVDQAATPAERKLARERLRAMPAVPVRMGAVQYARDSFGRLRGVGGMVQDADGNWSRA